MGRGSFSNEQRLIKATVSEPSRMQWDRDQHIKWLEVGDYSGERFSEVIGSCPLTMILELDHCSTYPALERPDRPHLFENFWSRFATTPAVTFGYTTTRTPGSVEVMELVAADIAYPRTAALASRAALRVNEVDCELSRGAERFSDDSSRGKGCRTMEPAA